MTAPVNYASLYEPPAPVKDWNPLAQIVQIFAEDNGWPYYPFTADQPLPGVIFRERDGRPRSMQRSVNIVRIPGPPLTEIGNSFYTEYTAAGPQTKPWGYVALQLESEAPPLVLANQRLSRRSPLPSLPDVTPMPFKNQDRFLLYADPGAFAWADWLFDDELQTLLDDGTLGFHVEITGGSLFLYAPHPLAVPDPTVWQRLLALISALRTRLGGRLPEPLPPIASPRPPIPNEPPYASAPLPPASTTGQGPVRQPASLPMRSNELAVNFRRNWIVWTLVLAGGVAAAITSIVLGPLR
ncbi:hypothetical protein [Microbacterium sp. Clip185]|uniref:hypothetical protein n=1 Tax=Microbacterium sp. Clip185 TaxID=3025663 RepID=UPI00236724E5|nr:hypothetical protein [Microbacterium sp. Clip185]WDG18029.1 hypothetical protein PQV94_15600 [Microbacterium sp. Clip185]